MEKEEELGPEPPPVVPQRVRSEESEVLPPLLHLRRRRHPPKAGDDSDLSEGFDSDSSHGSAGPVRARTVAPTRVLKVEEQLLTLRQVK